MDDNLNPNQAAAPMGEAPVSDETTEQETTPEAAPADQTAPDAPAM